MDEAQDLRRGDPASPGLSRETALQEAGAPGVARPHGDGSRAAGGRTRQRRRRGKGSHYAAIDLGTNNCRLLIARPSSRGFEVVDAFSRIVRLGEGVARSGTLSEAAMARTVAALRVCASKMRRRNVDRARVVATEACRIARNADAFIARVAGATGLELDVVSAEEEARLAVLGCAPLLDTAARRALVFDIGGGSTELVWLDMTAARGGRDPNIRAWASLPVGVVTLSDRYEARSLDAAGYAAMVREVEQLLRRPLWSVDPGADLTTALRDGQVHLLGTSGTVTTIAGIHLGLPRYDRSRVDGTWIDLADVAGITRRLSAMTFEERVGVPCVGRERADLVLAGCAILEAIQNTWPCQRLRVADRGLREGILTTLMREDARRRKRRRSGA